MTASTLDTPKDAPRAPPKFTQGSILRHVLVMTGTGAVGLVAIFVVDFFSLLYVSWLNDPALTAGVGYSTQVNFFCMSINIGTAIAVTALVSRAQGARDRPLARRRAASGLVHVTLFACLVAVVAILGRDAFLDLLGASGQAKQVASRFLLITLPSNAFMAAGMALGGILRSVGDARRAMYVTLSGGVMTAFTDPLFIFGLGLGVYGAAYATILSRVMFIVIGLYFAVRVHDLIARPRVAEALADASPLFAIALPAILTNLATPVGNSYALRTFSQFGENAVAASAVLDRLVPVAFGVIFALSGAVGPVLGQNLGAGRIDRVKETITESFRFTLLYAAACWLALWLGSGLIVAAFKANAETARYIVFFCTWGITAWLFMSLLFVANACFNNLGFPLYSTLFNWGRATLGTIPFVTLGARWGGVEGGQLGIVAGAFIFGTASVATTYFALGRLAKRPGSV